MITVDNVPKASAQWIRGLIVQGKNGYSIGVWIPLLASLCHAGKSSRQRDWLDPCAPWTWIYAVRVYKNYSREMSVASLRQEHAAEAEATARVDGAPHPPELGQHIPGML